MCDEKCAALAMALIDIDELAASKGDSENKFSEAAAEIIANLRSHNRDLQQAYDHVLECEQNRCREVVELQDRLAEVTAERDDLRDTAAAMMTAACGTDDIDEQERLCNAAGTKPSHYIASLRKQLAELQQRLDEAPVAWCGKDKFGFWCVYDNERSAEIAGEDHGIPADRVRLVPDPETPNA